VIHRGTWIQAGSIIRDGTVIGCDGVNAYAYQGQDGKPRVFPHFGGVLIGENVEIGANSVIVRGILNSTRIGRNSVIGNMGNIGHAAELSEQVWMSVGCRIGGYTRIGSRATLGIGATVKDSIEIGEQATIGIGSVVIQSVAPYTSVFGNPARKVPTMRAFGPPR
jgi:UDP-3-O-[3-hydroxymyristoyl] glucosamine N-acyltransferase